MTRQGTCPSLDSHGEVIPIQPLVIDHDNNSSADYLRY